VKYLKSAGLVAIGVGAGLLAGHIHRTSPGQFEMAEANQPTEENRRVQRLDTSAAPMGAQATSGRRSAPVTRTETSAAQQQADSRALQVRLDDRLRSESMDPTWARDQEAAILAAVSGDDKDGFPADLPRDMDTQCRSSLCKVTMTFADEEDAYQMQTKLTLGLRGPIATARTFYSVRPDGAMDVIVYAGNTESLR
jgi:hypothetical protein